MIFCHFPTFCYLKLANRPHIYMCYNTRITTNKKVKLMQPSKAIKLKYPNDYDLIHLIKEEKITSLTSLAKHFSISPTTLNSLIDSYGLTRESLKEYMKSPDVARKTKAEFMKFAGLNEKLKVHQFIYDGVEFFVYGDSYICRATIHGFKQVNIEYRKEGDPTLVYYNDKGQRKSIQMLRLMYIGQSGRLVPQGYKVVKVDANSPSYQLSNLTLVRKRKRKSNNAEKIMAEMYSLWMNGNTNEAIKMITEHCNQHCNEQREKEGFEGYWKGGR